MRAAIGAIVLIFIGSVAVGCRSEPAQPSPQSTTTSVDRSDRSAGPAAAFGDGPHTSPTAADRGVTFGLLLDSPRPIEVIDEGIEIADRLRQRYRLDTGDPLDDRLEASRRARADLIDRLRFSETELGATARALGYSLEPDACRDYCDNVRRLAELELQKEALRAFAAGDDGPGRLDNEALEQPAVR